MKKAGWMELNKFHVRDGSAGDPSHRHPVSSRDVGVRRVEVDLPAPTRGQDHSIAPDGLDLSGGFMEDVNTDHAILGRIAELASRDQINTHVIIENLDIGFFSHRVEQTLINFARVRIMIMKDASFGVASIPPEIQLPLAIVQDSFVKVDTDSHQFLNSGRSFGHDRAHGFRSQSPAPAVKVSEICISNESSPLVTHAIPPWAQTVLESVAPR